MTSPMDAWTPGGPSLIELRDQAFEQMRHIAQCGVLAGDQTVEVDPKALLGLIATLKAHEEMEAAAPSRRRHDHTSTDPSTEGPNGPADYIDGCPIDPHRTFSVPGFEYKTTTGQRKNWDYGNVPPEGDGWVRNTAAGRDGWDRFEYHEESYWMRPKPKDTTP